MLGWGTMTTESCTNGATTLSCVSFSGYVGRVTISSWMLTIVSCSVVWLGLGVDLVFGWLLLCTRIFNTFRFHFTIPIVLQNQLKVRSRRRKASSQSLWDCGHMEASNGWVSSQTMQIGRILTLAKSKSNKIYSKGKQLWSFQFYFCRVSIWLSLNLLALA